MTKVKVDFYKYTGKWYDSFEYKSDIACWNILAIKKEVESKREFINSMDFTIEVDGGSKGWNKYLFLKH